MLLCSALCFFPAPLQFQRFFCFFSMWRNLSMNGKSSLVMRPAPVVSSWESLWLLFPPAGCLWMTIAVPRAPACAADSTVRPGRRWAASGQTWWCVLLMAMPRWGGLRARFLPAPSARVGFRAGTGARALWLPVLRGKRQEWVSLSWCAPRGLIRESVRHTARNQL